MFAIPKPNSDPEEIQKLLKKQGVGNECYAMSCNYTIDGKRLSLSSALEVAAGEGFPLLILCVEGKLAYFEAEHSYCPPPRFILKR